MNRFSITVLPPTCWFLARRFKCLAHQRRNLYSISRLRLSAAVTNLAMSPLTGCNCRGVRGRELLGTCMLDSGNVEFHLRMMISLVRQFQWAICARGQSNLIATGLRLMVFGCSRL
jgi:hypothetical protein